MLVQENACVNLPRIIPCLLMCSSSVLGSFITMERENNLWQVWFRKARMLWSQLWWEEMHARKWLHLWFEEAGKRQMMHILVSSTDAMRGTDLVVARLRVLSPWKRGLCGRIMISLCFLHFPSLCNTTTTTTTRTPSLYLPPPPYGRPDHTICIFFWRVSLLCISF